MLDLSDYSGVILNQNQAPTGVASVATTNYYQTFTLPADYARTTTINGQTVQTIPDLTGFQLYASIAAGQATLARLSWTFDVFNGSTDAWDLLASGTTQGNALDGASWFSVYFADSVPIAAAQLQSVFRINLIGSFGFDGLYYSVPNPLQDGNLYSNGSPITVPSYTVTASATHNNSLLTSVAASGALSVGDLIISPDLPNDTIITGINGATLDLSNNFTGITGAASFTAGPSSAFLFRLLGATADSGTDFLGNIYRSVASAATADNVRALTTPGVYGYWMSQPYPSAFGVSSLYLDVSEFGPTVIDRFTLDPLTPGVYFHVYFSNDPTGPGTDVASWENLLWTPVYQTYRATRRQTFALPSPIAASYVKIEFSGLQAKAYDPGQFQRPSTYKKYPKWVLDYFVAQFQALELDLLSDGVNITYDALDLAYNYYTADVISNPSPPSQATATKPSPGLFLGPTTSIDQVDPISLSRIDLGLSPFTAQPALLGNPNAILGAYVRSVASPNYSVENIRTAQGNTDIVSNSLREPLLIERAFPSMFFYLPCRHTYRLAQATFDRSIAYFAGVKSLVLHRDIYTGPTDQDQYTEVLADGTNVALNDFDFPSSLDPLQPLGLFSALALS